MAKSIYTLPDVAEILQTSLSTVRREIRSGQLEAIIVGRRQIRVTAQALNRYLQSRGSKAVVLGEQHGEGGAA